MTSSVSATGSATQILSSALQGFGKQAAVAANNIVNADSTNYKSQRADVVSTAPGMRVVVTAGTQDVNSTAELVNLQTASTSYQASAVALGSIARTEKRAFDVMG